LGAVSLDETEAKKKPCPPCKKRKKGKCKGKLPNGTACPGGTCRTGSCQAISQPPPSVPICTPKCRGKVCGDNGCGGVCGVCESNEACADDGTCLVVCVPPCADTEECRRGVCYTTCDPTCTSGEGCIDGACEPLSGGCDASADWCSDDSVACPDETTARCALTDEGEPFCALSVTCRGDGSNACQTDEDCQNDGIGPNARCVANCIQCTNNANGCLEFYLDA
jgi:hypothetical protein